MEENLEHLDLEFKKYLQILRPYFGQLTDEDAINICNAWIKRLSNCSEKEKPIRNKYIFVLCYQLAKGILDIPFIHCPPVEELPQIAEVADSDSSSDPEEYVDESNTKIIFSNKKPIQSDTEYLSQDNANEKEGDSSREFDSKTHLHEQPSEPSRKQTLICYTCPEMMRACMKELNDDDHYEFRANNLIMRLREIKKQNMLLHNELVALKEESKTNSDKDKLKIDNTTSVLKNSSSCTLKSLKSRIKEYEEDKINFIDTITNLQDQIDNFNEMKKLEIENIQAKHKHEILNLKSSMRGESKVIYEEKYDDLKKYYDELIINIKTNNELEIQELKKRHAEALFEKDKIVQETVKAIQNKDAENTIKGKNISEYENKIMELEKIVKEKEKALEEANKTINDKNKEIAAIKTQVDDRSENFQSVLQKLLEKSSAEVTSDSMKLKAHELEKRLCKMEKAKSKCAKVYESKLACLQREKHLTECSLQLQLVRQRTQVINEIADENQAELQTALDRLEAKYKDIVANVQSTAIQRRVQDQIALDSVLQAACGIRNEMFTNQSQFSGKTITVQPKEENHSYDTEISGTRNKGHPNRFYGDESIPVGYCLDSERFGELFEKMHIPQRDIADLSIRK